MKKKKSIPTKEAIESKLPKGIELIDLKEELTEDKMRVYVKFRFEHIDLLEELDKLDVMEQGNMGAKEKSKKNSIKVKKEGKYLIIYQEEFSNPFGGMDKNPEMGMLPPEMKTMMERSLSKGGMFYRFAYPYGKYKIVKDNAHKHYKEKHILEWNFSLGKIMNDPNSLKPIYVKLEEK